MVIGYSLIINLPKENEEATIISRYVIRKLMASCNEKKKWVPKLQSVLKNQWTIPILKPHWTLALLSYQKSKTP